jgi:hypothetical protein
MRGTAGLPGLEFIAMTASRIWRALRIVPDRASTWIRRCS